jgi:hypothetical protein
MQSRILICQANKLRNGVPVPRLRRFSLRELFIAFTVAAVVFGLIGYERYVVNQQASAISQIESLGGVPLLVDYREHRAYTVTPTQKPRFTFLNYIFGKDYFIYAPVIDLTGESLDGDKVRSMIPYIKQLRMKEGMNESGKTNVCLSMSPALYTDSQLMSDIERQLPNCKVLRPVPGARGGYQ